MQGYFDFRFTIDNLYALFLTPNAYGSIRNAYFYALFIFSMRF